MNKTIKSLLLCFAAMLFVISASAQVTTSSLNGRITDMGGEPIPGATVVAVHTPSGSQYYSVTNEEGRYFINGMRAGGPYSVEISTLGYQTVNYTDITLQLAESYNLSAKLADDKEMLSEAVVISTAATRFATEKTGAATNINNAQITAIPTVSRSITDVTRLSPYGGNGMKFAGADGRTANFTVDGANFNNNFGLSDKIPGGGSPISIDAIEEMQVVISPYDVRQTNFIGGGINAITKSGTNTVKGSAFVYHRNENMRGDAVCGDLITSGRDSDRQTTYGFTLGGPIVKNKLFYFVNAEYTKTPTIANRWHGSKNGVANADDFVSRTTLSDLQKVSEFAKSEYGYDTGSWEDFPADESNMKFLGRIDWNINDKNKLTVRYNYTLNRSWSSPNGSSMDGGSRMPSSRMSKNSMSYANSMYSIDNYVNTWSVDFNSRITDNLSNQFLATFSKLDDLRGTNSSEFPFIDILKTDEDGNTDNYMALGYELFTWNNAVHNTVATVKDDLTWYNGDHKVTGGISYEYQMADNSYMRNGTGYYRYSSVDDFISKATPETVALTYGYDGELNPAARVRFHKPSIYAQDEWQVNDNFKLTAGIRLDGLFFDNRDLMTNASIYSIDWNADNADLYKKGRFSVNEAGEYVYDAKGDYIKNDDGTYGTIPGRKSIDTGKWPSASITVSPRVGFTWDVLGDKSFKLRGGTGLFSGRLPLVFFTNMPTNSGMVQYQAAINAGKTVPDGYTGRTEVRNGKTYFDMSEFAGGVLSRAELYEKLISLGYPSTISPEDGTIPSNFSAVDSKFKMPQVWKTSLAIDYAFPTSFPFTVSVEGIFNKTINGVVLRDWSVKDPNGFARFNGVDNRPIYDTNSKLTYLASYKVETKDGVTTYTPQYKNMPNAYVLENTSKGYGYSGSVTVNMEPVQGLRLMAAYTHTASKELTSMPGSNASSVLNYMGTVNGPNNPGLHNSQNVTPDRFVASLTHSDRSGNHYSFIYETWRGGFNYAYMTTNDINNDGFNYDLIYIPTDAQVANKEFRFVSDDDAARFMDYVHADKYLSKHQGEYAEAYSVYSPWVHRLDFSYKHDFSVKVGKSTNTLQLSLDVKNILK
ncbi:MAG TPA: TonB-dependent receptor, partial [Rikenellaceae bacterium]|nr:TonB-dependent receptor [Rikenellaceae bacterium]